MNLATSTRLRAGLVAVLALLAASTVLYTAHEMRTAVSVVPPQIRIRSMELASSPPPPSPSPIVRPPVAADLRPYWDQLPLPQQPYKVDIALPRVAIETTEGTLHCALSPNAPMTVANFIGLASGQKPFLDPITGQVARRPFYDGLTFHRVIPGFMIQAGDPLGAGTGGPGYEFGDEITPDTFRPGMLAMANKGPNTNGSQFFITEESPAWLDGHYTIFGTCAELDVVKRIANVPRNSSDRPLQPVVIQHITLTRY